MRSSKFRASAVVGWGLPHAVPDHRPRRLVPAVLRGHAEQSLEPSTMRSHGGPWERVVARLRGVGRGHWVDPRLPRRPLLAKTKEVSSCVLSSDQPDTASCIGRAALRRGRFGLDPTRRPPPSPSLRGARKTSDAAISSQPRTSVSAWGKPHAQLGIPLSRGCQEGRLRSKDGRVGMLQTLPTDPLSVGFFEPFASFFRFRWYNLGANGGGANCVMRRFVTCFI